MSGNIKKMAVGRKDIFFLSPEDIHEEDGWNARTENDELAEHIRSLADSIKAVGVLEPITGYMDGELFTITNGHCRNLAVKLAISEGAEIKSVPVRLENKHINDADRVLSILTRNSGKPLSTHEQAAVIKRLLDYGWTEAEISEKTGLSRQRVGTLVKYLSSPVEVQQMVKKGEVSATTAVKQIRKEGKKAVETLKKAVGKAQGEGKKKATAQHIPVKKDLVRPIEDFAGKLPVTDGERMERILAICGQLRELIEGVE